MDPSTLDRAQKLRSMIQGYFIAQAIYVAARLGIADLLAASATSELSIDEIAQKTGSNVEALYRVLRALASEGVFEERDYQRFALTLLGEGLRSDVPGSMLPAALMAGEAQFKVWSLFKDVVKHGTPGFDRVFRMPLFPFLEEHPEIYALFNQAMTHRVALAREAILAACEVHPGDTIVDIGGGLGTLLLALLEKHPQAQGILLDLPKVIAEARQSLRTDSLHITLKNRLTFHAGDFLHTVPPGNVMVLVTVLHMFQDPQALQVLQNCHQSLRIHQELAQTQSNPTPGRIYIVEKLLRAPNQPDPGKWDDLNMMVMTGGKERTFHEFANLLKIAGFTHVQQLSEGILTARV